ncbi:MAG: YceH family protein [Pseudomonadota bacterium]
MPIYLTDTEARVIGCLMEKSVVTPDQYPLTLNALTNACNQKSSRQPVMSLSQGEVQHTVRKLQDKHLVATAENFRSQVEKYSQRLCNTPFSNYQFSPAQFSIICTLLLRGPRTPGELRANSGRLHTFSDNNAVLEALQELSALESGPLVAELPRTPGRRDAEFMHLLQDPDTLPVRTSSPTPVAMGSPGSPGSQPEPSPNTADPSVADRLAALEQAVASLTAELAELRQSIPSLNR